MPQLDRLVSLQVMMDGGVRVSLCLPAHCPLPTMVYLLYSSGPWSSSLFCDHAAQACDINQLISQQYKQSRAKQSKAINQSIVRSIDQAIDQPWPLPTAQDTTVRAEAGRTNRAGLQHPALPPEAFRPCFYSSLLGGPHLGPPDTLVSDPTPSPSPPSTQTWPQPTGNWHHNLRLECRACGAATC